ncbi:MAG: Na+/H+ antiporter subunit E [Peptococcaceae bacterium]
MDKKMNENSTSKTKHFVVLTLVLFIFWVLLSGKLQPKYLIIGFASAAIASWITLPLLRLPAANGKGFFYAFDFPYAKYFTYWFWLLKEIIKANIDIALVVLNPKLPINPRMIRFKMPMANPIAHVTLANSITLTPGTITVDVEDGVYTIHALTDGAGDALLPEKDGGEMQVKVAKVFNEEAGSLASVQKGEAV